MRLLDKEQFDLFYQFLGGYFPKKEIKEYNHYSGLFYQGKIKVAYEYDDDFEYIISYFDLPDKIFIDYFAINKKYQGQGKGTRILKEFIALMNKPVLLEVELPEGDIQKRRISFYQNIGFHLNEYEYIIPKSLTYTEDLQFYLMSYPEAIQKEDYQNLYENILKDIYQK